MKCLFYHWKKNAGCCQLLECIVWAWQFDLATGLRIGELCALKWSDINFQKQTVKISRTLQRIKKSQSEWDDDFSYGHCTHIMEASVKTLSDILGHRQVQITMDLYCHTSLDHMRDVMNSMADLF